MLDVNMNNAKATKNFSQYISKLGYVDKIISLPFLFKLSKSILLHSFINILTTARKCTEQIIKMCGNYIVNKICYSVTLYEFDYGIVNIAVKLDDFLNHLKYDFNGYNLSDCPKIMYIGSIPSFVTTDADVDKRKSIKQINITVPIWYKKKLIKFLENSIDHTKWSQLHLDYVKAKTYKLCQFPLREDDDGDLDKMNYKIHDIFKHESYTDIEEEINNYFNISELANMHTSPLIIFYKGQPGVGKTMVIDYLGKNLYNKLLFKINIDFGKYGDNIEKLFDEISNFLNDKNNDDKVILIDEIDKMYKYGENLCLKNVIEKSNNISIEAQENIQTQMKLTFKKYFLDSLFNFINKMPGKNVILFCVNSIDMFDQPNQEHIPLISRIIFKSLGPYDHDNICNYIRFYNQKFKNSDYFIEDLETQLEYFKKDINISARKLTQLLVQYKFDIRKIISEINLTSNEITT